MTAWIRSDPALDSTVNRTEYLRGCSCCGGPICRKQLPLESKVKNSRCACPLARRVMLCPLFLAPPSPTHASRSGRA